MRINNPNNEFNKAPSERARKFGIVAALFVCAIFSIFPLGFIYVGYRDGIESLHEQLGFIIATTILFILSLILLHRIAYGKARKLSAKQILGIGYAAGVSSFIMAIAAIFSDTNNVHMAVISLAAIPISIRYIQQGKRLLNDS